MLLKVVKGGLIERVVFEQRLKEVRVLACRYLEEDGSGQREQPVQRLGACLAPFKTSQDTSAADVL